MKLLKIYEKAIIMLSASTLILFSAGCDRAESPVAISGNSIIDFNASVGQVIREDQTKAVSSYENHSETIHLTSADGSIVIPLTIVETANDADPVTKGSLINGPLDGTIPDDSAPIPLKDSLDGFVTCAYYTDSQVAVFNPETDSVKWNGTNWRMDKTYYWPQSSILDFYAWANMPSSEFATISVDKSARTQTLEYIVPTNARDQKDILIAMYSGTGDNEGKADLMFYHPLTAVQFSRARSLEITGITQIIMTGVNYSGEVTQTMSSPASLSWSVSDMEATVSQDNDGKPFEVHGDIDGDPFLLVPQQVSGLRNVVLTVTLIYNGHEIPLNAVISNTSWLAGRTYTYYIGYDGNLEVSLDLQETSYTEKGSAVISNAGTQKCFVRAIVDGFVTDKDGFIKRTYLGNEGKADGVGTFTVTSGTFGTGTWNTNWVMGDDGFYYYTIPLEVDNAEHTNPAAKTTPLFNSYVFNGLNAYEYYEMNISTQAIEWDYSKSYVTANWGEAAANLLQ